MLSLPFGCESFDLCMCSNPGCKNDNPLLEISLCQGPLSPVPVDSSVSLLESLEVCKGVGTTVPLAGKLTTFTPLRVDLTLIPRLGLLEGSSK